MSNKIYGIGDEEELAEDLQEEISNKIIEELEKIKEEMQIIHDRYKINIQGYSMSVAKECIEIINNHIAELKGE